MIEEYIKLRSKKYSLLNQYATAGKEEKAIIKKEYEKVDVFRGAYFRTPENKGVCKWKHRIM